MTPAENSAAKDIRIPARDGYALAATLYATETSNVVVVISSATAVPRQFYRHYANALQTAGFAVITYDYRGVGESKPETLKGFEARAQDWALLDTAGVIDWLQVNLRPKNVFIVGHSYGGQTAGLLDVADQIDGMVTVSAQSGYWGVQPGFEKWRTGFHVHISMPLLNKIFGYMPWSLIAGGEDLPYGAAKQWTAWCRDPEYLLGDATLPLERFDDFVAPVRAYSIDDDVWGSARGVDAMMKAYPNVERHHLIPADLGLGFIGHFGYFRPAAETLWAADIDWFRTTMTSS
ncbi:MAG: alpha/beta fold hydrolase [Pseudomonadota bacterium]